MDAFGETAALVGEVATAPPFEAAFDPSTSELLKLREDVDAPSRGCVNGSDDRGDLDALPMDNDENKPDDLESVMMRARLT